MKLPRPRWPTYGGGHRLRRSLLFASYEGTLAAASDNFGLPFLPLFAVAMGASPLQVSLVTAIPNFVANALQLPFGRLAERTGQRKRLWLLGNGVVRFVWVPMAALPWLVRDRQLLIMALLALTAVRGLAAAAALPAWTALMADLTRRQWRGHYFAIRNILANLVALAATVAGGWLIGRLGYPAGYAAVFGAAWLVGVFSLLVILPVHDPSRAGRAAPRKPRAEAAGALPPTVPSMPLETGGVRRPLFPSDLLAGGPRRWRSEAPGFFEWAVTAFIWNAAVNLPMALFPIYFTNDLHGSASLWGISNGVTFLMTVLGQRYWGRLCDTTGQRPVMVWSGLWAALLPLWWAIIPSPEWVVAINVVGGFGWAGFNLAAFNLLLEVTPDNRRPSYVAVFNLGVGIASSVAPILGAWVAEAIGIPAVMVASGVLRLASLLLFSRWGGVPVRWIPLPKSSSTVARWTQRPAGWRPSPRARRSQAP